MAEETDAGATPAGEYKIPVIPIETKAGQASLGVALALITDKARQGAGEERAEKKTEEEPPVVTHHEIMIDGLPLRYTVTTGLMPLKNEQGETEARLFFMAYTRDEAGSPSERPLMFSFNGGPGSSSVWLHLGALGPRRVQMREDGSLPPPPYRMVDNPLTWLTDTDLVFIDPVGTGFSRAEKPELGKKFWSVEGDIESIGEFIRLYLTRHERWASPLFLVGESYGTTRAAGLAGHLIDKGIAFNGIVLVSSVLNFQTLDYGAGNDLPYILFLPTFAATAFYHLKLDDALQQNLAQTLAEVEAWAANEYTLALAKGAALTAEERQETVRRLARYTGLSQRYVDDSDLRVNIFRFCKELLRDERRTVGRLDSRFKGMDAVIVTERPDHDPSMTAIRPPYTAVFNNYVRACLQYKTDLPYHILGGGIKTPWNWGGRSGYVDTSEALQSAFAKNPYMKLFIASGYYDLATPYFATEYTLNHLGLDLSLRANITTAEYEAGHMMYIHTPSLKQLKTDVAGFLLTAQERNNGPD